MRVAANGSEGLERLREAPLPLFIALDLASLAMTGAAFREVLETDAQLRDLPIVVVSGLRSADQPPTPVYISTDRAPPLELRPILRSIEDYRVHRELLDGEAPTSTGFGARRD